MVRNRAQYRARAKKMAVARESATKRRALRAQDRAIDSQPCVRFTLRVIAPHAHAIHARRPLIAVLEEVGHLSAVCRLSARRDHRDGEERREGVEQSMEHRFELQMRNFLGTSVQQSLLVRVRAASESVDLEIIY